MNRRACIAVVAAAGIATVAAASRATAGNGWMMERMADDLNRLNEQAVRNVPLPADGRVRLDAAVKVSPEKSPAVRVVRATVAEAPVVRRLPIEAAATPAYESLIREARLDIPVVVSR